MHDSRQFEYSSGAADPARVGANHREHVALGPTVGPVGPTAGGSDDAPATPGGEGGGGVLRLGRVLERALADHAADERELAVALLDDLGAAPGSEEAARALSKARLLERLLRGGDEHAVAAMVLERLEALRGRVADVVPLAPARRRNVP
jgi:hypothetical protein